MIQVQNLVKRYGDHLAVDDLSFTIEKGQIYGFLGPNGAGKSTTMNIMTGYIGATSGHVIINGHDIMEEPEQAKTAIGYLPELPPLYMDMKVREYLYFAAELKRIPKDKRDEEVARVVKSTSLENVYERLISNLSKGYKQRVGIAQAILGSPEIIILDEPTVGLDPTQIIEIRDLIRELAKQHTIILSSHILAEVQEVCTQLLIIHNGKLVANGTPAELERKLGAASIEITVKSSDLDAVKAMLFTVPGIKGISCSVNEQLGEISVKIKTLPDADIREGLFRACVEAGIPLLMSRNIEFSLETLFLELVGARPQAVKKRRIIRKVVKPAAAADGEAKAETEGNE